MKRLVICFDGTWNNADNAGSETNVARIARAIHAHAGDGLIQQVVLYLRGVGTSGLHAETVIEGAIGLGVDDNIRSGFMFLAQNYIPGDEIFLFGFSRGAFTARSLAGFVAACGLLKRQQLGAIGKAWEYYRTDKPHDPSDFKMKTGVDTHLGVRIRFLGVWDTVGALGIPAPALLPFWQSAYSFHDTGPSAVVEHGCHALALDEHRDEFVPTFWTGDVPAGVMIEQVWFAGVHADVGGGYRTRGLADIPLVWMAEKAEADGLELDWSCLPDPEKLDPRAPMHESRTGVFLKDRLTPTYRRVCETNCRVTAFERLYAPHDASNKILRTIGESVHDSVRRRYGATAAFCVDDEAATTRLDLYKPKNFKP